MENLNDTYFDGYYKELWREIIPGELTNREVDFMLPYFHLQPGSKVLDLMCGYGRHALALARKGMAVTAVDNLDDYINEVREVAEREQLALKAIKADVMKYRGDDQFDLILCMGNSLNFFNAEQSQELLSHISSLLKTGAHLFINTWSLAEIAIRQFKEKTWSAIGDKKFIVESQFLFHPTRIESEHLILSPDGRSETKKGIDYIFSLAELEVMFSKAGLNLVEVYSIPGKKKFTVGEPRAYIIVQKV